MLNKTIMRKSFLQHGAKGLAAVFIALWGLQPSYSEDTPLDVASLTIEELQAGYASAAYTAEEVTQAFLNRIEEYEPSYNAFTFIAEDALEQARAIDKRRAAGEALGPFAGIPLVIKESIDVKGFPSTAGWKALSPQHGGVRLMPVRDATLVARLRHEGAIIIGKGNIPQFSVDNTRPSYSWDGPTYNAVQRETAPGGSSSGVATAVAAGFAVAGIGEETGGSIQNPSSAQSLVGLKPTLGLVPASGLLPIMGSTMDVAGPMAKSVYDAAALMDVIVGYTAEDGKTLASVGNTPSGGYVASLGKHSLKGARIGIFGPGWNGQPLSEDVQALYDNTVSELTEQGAVLIDDPFAGSDFSSVLGLEMGRAVHASILYDLNQYLGGLAPLQGVNPAQKLARLLGKDPVASGRLSFEWASMDKKTWESMAEHYDHFASYEVYELDAVPSAEDYLTPPDLSSYVQIRERYLDIFNNVMEKHHLDALVFPQIMAAPPKLFSDQTSWHSAWQATAVPYVNFLGLPGLVVPAGAFENRAPYAAIFIGRMWSEATLLSLAHDYEQATRHRQLPNLVKATE